MRRYTFFLLTSILILSGCTEEIDKSARYVFKEVTITDYLQKHEEYTQYTELLKIVPVSERSKSSVFQLLTARGNYTVFAPTNEAIHNYLQQLTDKEFISAPSWEAFTDSFKLDSIRKVIVYNSIIDSGDDEEAMQTFDFPEKSNGEFPQANLYDLKLTVFYPEKSPDSIYINRTCAINSRNRDIPAINGYIHQMESVIAPEEITMAGILTKYIQGDQQGFLVMANSAMHADLWIRFPRFVTNVMKSSTNPASYEKKCPQMEWHLWRQDIPTLLNTANTGSPSLQNPMNSGKSN